MEIFLHGYEKAYLPFPMEGQARPLVAEFVEPTVDSITVGGASREAERSPCAKGCGWRAVRVWSHLGGSDGAA